MGACASIRTYVGMYYCSRFAVPIDPPRTDTAFDPLKRRPCHLLYVAIANMVLLQIESIKLYTKRTRPQKVLSR
jgi:hypothetical protein